MATADQFVAEAKRWIGTTESPPGSNRNPFAAIAGHQNGLSWCATACVAWARNVGLQLPSESPYTPTMADGFRKAGRFYSADPKPGDLAFFDFPDSTYRIQHVGVVIEHIDSKTIRSCEGNTSSGNYGSQDNGGGVFERVRPLSYIKGFGRPAFDEPAITLKTEELEMAVVVSRPQGGYLVVAPDGGVFAYDGAPFKGSIPGLPNVKLGGNVSGGAWTEDGLGYWLVATDGAVYAFGSAKYLGGFNAETPQTRGQRYAIGIVRTQKGYRVVTKDPSNDGSPFDAYSYGV